MQNEGRILRKIETVCYKKKYFSASMQFVKFAHKDFSYPVNIGDVRITITK